jgi:chromosomal replication initiator protein
MQSAQAVTVWQEILEYIEQKTTAQQFATWFRTLQADSIGEQKVVLTVPSRFHRDWIATYYRDVVETAVATVLGGPREVHLEVAVREAPEAPPARPAPAQAPAAAPAKPAAREGTRRGTAPAPRGTNSTGWSSARATSWRSRPAGRSRRARRPTSRSSS